MVEGIAEAINPSPRPHGRGGFKLYDWDDTGAGDNVPAHTGGADLSISMPD